MSNTRELFVDAIRSAIGLPYKWGGQSPEVGFDCSGLILWAMGKAGRHHEDMSANGLAKYYHSNKILEALARPGCLTFYGKNDEIDHVMVVLSVWGKQNGWPAMTVAGARGGDSNVVTIGDAVNANAFVDVQYGDYWRRGFKTIVDPFIGQE